MKFFEKVYKARKNNKGFTLVELIIVIAIIAVLAAVLAPRYLQYVERSRQSNDLQVATSIMRAATAAVADPNNNAAPGGTYTFTWSTSGDAPTLEITDTSANADDILESTAEVMGWEIATGGSATGTETIVVDDAESAAGNSADFIFTISMTDGNVTMASASLGTNGAAWGTAGVGMDYPTT